MVIMVLRFKLIVKIKKARRGYRLTILIKR